jgi:diguanylate cyclase (GGDEF)-like protein
MLDVFLLETIFRDASDPVVLINTDRTVKIANPAFRAVARKGRDGTDFMELVSYHARDRVSRELVRAAGGEEVLLDVPHPQDDETDRIVEYRFFPVEGGMVAGLGRVRHGDQGLNEQLGQAKAELKHKARMLDEIQMELTQVPFIDPVTGVWNRLQVIERLTGEWSRSERWGSPLACLMVDVEGLDKVRSRDGQPVADDLLRAVARRIKTVVRDHDIVGRFSGDRFVIMAVHCDAEGGRSLARRILECVHGEPVAVAGRSMRVEVRIGCCTSRSDGVEIMEDLFQVATTVLADARTRAIDFACADEG